MVLPKLEIGQRRMYPAWLRGSFGVLGLLFGLALANLLFLTFTNSVNVEAGLIVAGFGTLFFVAAGMHYYCSRPGNKAMQAQVKTWAKERYDITLSERQAARLTRPAVARNIPFDGWVSFPISFFQKDASGMRRLIHLLLVQVDGDYIIFCPEAGGEYPINSQIVVKDNQEFMEEAWREMDEHGGLYVLTPEQGYFNGELVRARAAEGKDIALFWSDRLRADLWLNEDTESKSKDWQVSYLPINEVFNELLPAMARENQSVGLNWGEGSRAYDAHWFAQKLGQRFNLNRS